MCSSKSPVQEDDEDWETEHPDRIGRTPDFVIHKARLDLFSHSDLLDEREFDTNFAEYKLPNVYRRTAEQTVPVTSILPEYDHPEALDFYVNCKICDPTDAAILLNANEPAVVLQALEALIAFVEDRLGQFKNETAEETLDSAENADKKAGKKAVTDDDPVEGDEYFKNTLIKYPGFLRRVVQLTGSSYKSLQRRAIILLGSLSEVEEAVEEYESISWLKKLHHLIKPGTEPVILDWAVLALKNFSILHNVQEEVYHKGLLEPLLDLATYDNQDPDVVENILQTLINVSANKSIREHLALNGGFEVACEQALSEFPSTQYYALRLMRDLIYCPAEGALERFHEADGMATVISILNMEEFKFLHASTLEVLEYLLGVPSIAHELSQKRIYEFLLDRALSKEYQGVEDVQTFALRALSRAASFPDQRLIMNNCELERRVLQLLTLPSFAVQAAALQALGNLAKTMNCRRKLRELHVVTTITKQLSSCDPNIREQAFFAAGSLMLHETAFADDFQWEHFLRLLHSTLTNLVVLQSVGLVDQALACVINMSECENVKSALSTFVVKYIPVWLTQLDDAIKIKALLCAGIFVRNDHEREVFTKYHGYCAVGDVLKTPASDNLIRHACWAIAILAIDRASITEICKSGCVYPLLEIRNSANPVTCGYADLALRRLAGLHLSFKYALFNELGPDDRIQHGFYDAGKFYGRMSFFSLKGHLRASTSLSRPVIFVSLPRKRFVTAPFAIASNEIVITDEGKGITSKATPVSTEAEGKTKKAATKTRKTKSGTKPNVATESENLEPQSQPTQETFSEQIQPSPQPTTPKDPALQKVIKIILAELKTVRTIREEIGVIGNAVADHMGGPNVTPEHASKQVQTLCETNGINCVALGDIQTGSCSHRALLFKVIADRIHLPVSLVRGENSHAWNEIHLPEDGGSKVFVIDLMFQPGSLLPIDSSEAAKYMESEETPFENKHVSDLPQQSHDVLCRNSTETSVTGSDIENQLVVTGSAISCHTGAAVAASANEKDRLRRYTTLNSIMNPSSNQVRTTILRDMEAAAQALAQKIANLPGNDTKDREKGGGPKFRTEPRAPLKKWRPKQKHSQDTVYRVAIPRELPSLIEAAPVASIRFDKDPQKQVPITKTASWNPLRSRTSLQTSDIWDGAPQVPDNDIRRSVLPGVYEALAEAESEDIPEGYDVVTDWRDQITNDEQMSLERWEMDLEDDVADDHGDVSADEAEDVAGPGDDDKPH